MATYANILGATMSADCCDWQRGARTDTQGGIYIPHSTGDSAQDRVHCCASVADAHVACCASDTDKSKSSASTAPNSVLTRPYKDAPILQVPPASSYHLPVSPHSEPPTALPSPSPEPQPSLPTASPAASSSTASLPFYVQETNQARGSNPSLKWDANLAKASISVVDGILSNDCVVTAESTIDKRGVNTFALQGCEQPCAWADVINSWAAEKGHEKCGVTHRATLLNPAATRVGCSMTKTNNCVAAACMYDKKAYAQEAVAIAESQPTPPCANTCCGALPCANTLCRAS